jgi:hypothetical protein
MTQTSATAPQATKRSAIALMRVIERHTTTKAQPLRGTTAAVQPYATTKSVRVDSMPMTVRYETISVETRPAGTRTPAADYLTRQRLR